MRKYKEQTAKTRPWSEIEGHYTHLISRGWELDPMRQLVQHIIRTELSNRLFAYTSMDKLVIGIYDPMEWNREALHIEYDGTERLWSFKFLAKPNAPVEFERTYGTEEGMIKFDNFVKMLKW
jgi:hypothetical protein